MHTTSRFGRPTESGWPVKSTLRYVYLAVFFYYHLFAYLFYLLPNISVCVHMQRNQFQNYADEGTRILDSTPEGPDGESALRKFLKVSTNEINMILYHHFGVLAGTYLDSTIMLYRRLLGKCVGLAYC